MKSQKELEGRRKHLELPAIDREMLTGLLDNFEEVIAPGTNPQNKKAPSPPVGEEGAYP